jgi:predicted RecA/RadA family phage recombinase
MKNRVQTGTNLTIPAPYAVTSGSGVKSGLIFGVAAGDALSGADVDLVTTGVFTLPKVSTDGFAVGAAVFWNDTTKLVTSTVASNQKIGVAITAAPNPSGNVNVRLNGTF